MTMFNFPKRSVVLSLSLFFTGIIFFLSCSKNNSNINPGSPKASLLAFNLAPDKPGIGFSLGSTKLTPIAMAYANFTGTYLSIATGDNILKAYDFESSGSEITSTSGSFKADNFYSVFLVGNGANHKNVLVNDNIDSLSATSGLAYVRYVNAIPDSTFPPTITITSGSTDIVNETAIFPSVSAFKGVNPGNIDVAVKNSNGIDMSKTITVEQKKVYTILLVGVKDSTLTPLKINYISNGSLN